MTLDDFDIVVSTTDSLDSVQRRERITQCFVNAGITKYQFDSEPVCTTSPIPHLRPGYFGCDRHFANILKRNEGKNIIYFEDDAVVLADFIERFNYHLTQLPEDWQIFVAGYIGIWGGEMSEHINQDIIISTCFQGTQCLAIRKGDWRTKLIDDQASYDLYKYDAGAFDRCLAAWCRAHNMGLYLAARSFVGQSDCISIVEQRYKPLEGLPREIKQE